MRYILRKVIMCLLFSFILIGTISMQIANLHPITLEVSNLKFQNYTSSTISPDMVKDYIQIINLAYTYFADNILSTTLWIQNQLNHKYDKKYSVIIITENITGDSSIFQQSYVQWTGVNKAKPQWTYLIYVLLQDFNLESTYINSFIAGRGVDEAKQTLIRNAINNTQINCEGRWISDVINYMYLSVDGQYWNIIIKSSSDKRISGRLYSVKNQYYAFTSKKCEYLIFVSIPS